MSIEFKNIPPGIDRGVRPMRRLADAARDWLSLFRLAAGMLPVPTRLLDRLDERLACSRRRSFGRRSCVLSWQRESDGSWRARLSAPDLPRTIERLAHTRSLAIFRADRVLRRTRTFRARRVVHH